MKDTIVWGMIGCGDVTGRKNGPGLYMARNSRLAGVYNRTKSKAEDWVRRHGHGKVYDTVEELLADKEIDIVYIATTPNVHKQYALLCAQAGKHCYLEKPVAVTVAQAQDIQAAFAKAGKKCFVAHYRRGMERFKAIRQMMRDGTLGAVRYISITHARPPLEREIRAQNQGWEVDPAVSGGGRFFEWDVHEIDLMDFLAGPLKGETLWADNRTGYYPSEDLVTLQMRGRDGIAITGVWCHAVYKAIDRVEIAGDKGLLTFACWDNNAPLLLETAQGAQELHFPEPEFVGMGQEQDIVDELLGRGVCTSTLAASMRALEICCEANDALAKAKASL